MYYIYVENNLRRHTTHLPPMTIDTSFDPTSDSQSTIIIADNDVERSNKGDETIHVKIWRALAGKNEIHSKS